MVTKIDSLLIQKRLGAGWDPPKYQGPEGYAFRHFRGDGSIIVSIFPDLDNIEWLHASITRRKRMPTYNDLRLLHWAAFGRGWAYQVFAPPSEHLNIHEFALHLWGRIDGKPALPDFAAVAESVLGFKSI